MSRRSLPYFSLLLRQRARERYRVAGREEGVMGNKEKEPLGTEQQRISAWVAKDLLHSSYIHCHNLYYCVRNYKSGSLMILLILALMAKSYMAVQHV